MCGGGVVITGGTTRVRLSCKRSNELDRCHGLIFSVLATTVFRRYYVCSPLSTLFSSVDPSPSLSPIPHAFRECPTFSYPDQPRFRRSFKYLGIFSRNPGRTPSTTRKYTIPISKSIRIVVNFLDLHHIKGGF